MSSKSSIKNFKLSNIFFANLAIPLVAIVDTGLMGNLDKVTWLLPVLQQVFSKSWVPE